MHEVTPRTETTGVSAPAGPARATISRERTVRTTQGKYGKKGKSDVKKVSLHERLAEFPNGNLVIRGATCSVMHVKREFRRRKVF